MLVDQACRQVGVAGFVERAYTAFPRLREKHRRRATALSGGEAKMLSVAKEQSTDPTLLLVEQNINKAVEVPTTSINA